MPANKGKPGTVQLDLPDLWISATHRTLDRSDEVDEGTAMMSQCSGDSLDNHKPGLCRYIVRIIGFLRRLENDSLLLVEYTCIVLTQSGIGNLTCKNPL